MALAQYAVLDSSGNPVGTTTCNGDTCFPALQPGQSKVAMRQDVAAPAVPATPTVTTIDASGKRVQPGMATPSSPLPPVPPAVSPARSPSGATPGPTAGPAPIPASEMGYAAPQPAPSVPSSFGRNSGYPPPDPFANLPPYQNGMVHPASPYGQPLVPGGMFNQQQQSGYDNRQQVYVPGGAAAGPFETRAAYPTDAANGGSYGGSASTGASSGGGGGGSSLARDLYHQIRGNVESRLSGVGGSSSSYGSTSQQQYRRQGRRMDRAYEKYNDAIANPDPQKATGWAKQNLGENKGNYALTLTEPMAVAWQGMGLDPNSGTSDWLEGLPVADLAMIAGGSRGMTRKVQPPKMPHILKQQGVDPYKPENKKELDYSKYIGQLAEMYKGLTAPKGNVLNADTYLNQLAKSKNSGALRLGMDQQAQYDPGGAYDRGMGYFGSLFNATSDPMQAEIYTDMASNYAAQQNLLNKKPKHIDNMMKKIAQEFLK